MMRRLLSHVGAWDPEGRGYIALEYRHSKLADRLKAAGHIVRSREYAVEPEKDPFRLPRHLRRIALRNTGQDYDDKAAFPNAKAATVAPCKTAVRDFLRNREEIMEKLGLFFLPDDFIASRDHTTDQQDIRRTRRDNMKALFNSLDMDGSFEGWKRGQGIPQGTRMLRDLGEITVGAGQRFCLRRHISVMEVGSQWLTDKLPAMEGLIVQWLRTVGDKRRLQHPERTLASYVFQEMEGISRTAKIEWCTRGGHTVHNLQHDGAIIEMCRGMSPRDAARALSHECSCALGYEQTVDPPL